MTKINPTDIKFLIVHHTATNRDSTTFEAVRNYHIEKGWEDIGYHWFINGKGELKKGRDEKWVGAHAAARGKNGLSMNYQSLGICLAGNFEIEKPTKEQIATLENLLEKLRKERNIPRENVLGHQEIPASTACPGKNLLPYIKDYRERPETLEPISNMITFYKEKKSPTVYQLGADGLYHPILTERLFLDLYGAWSEQGKKFEIKEIEIPPEKVGYPIAGIVQ